MRAIIRTEFSEKTSLNKEMEFENGLKNIQAAAYNGARKVYETPVNFFLAPIISNPKYAPDFYQS